jgi:hypothetical protein
LKPGVAFAMRMCLVCTVQTQRTLKPRPPGLESQDRYFVQCFLDGKQPDESFYDGLEITELLMTAYMSAEQERTIRFRPKGLETYVPLVARGLWKGEDEARRI